MRFEGIYTPAVTPYNADGDINWNAYSDVLESLIEARVHGIIIGGSTGEYYAQTPEERTELAAYAKDVIGTRVQLIVSTGAIRTEDSVQYAKDAKAIKADAILVTSPPYALPTSEENAIHALAIDRAADLPIMLYNYPGRMSVSMDEDYLSRVVTSKNVIAIKESSGDMGRVHVLAHGYPQIGLSCGWDDQALEFFAWGARSWVCAGSNFLPKEHVALYEACVLEKNFDKGRQIMSAMMPLMNALDGGKFVQSIKYGCELIGLNVGEVRAPLQPLQAPEKQALQSVVTELQGNVARIVSEVSHG
ncbi:dihydrodipicolinate synthase family protein [Pseudomonas sp. CCM 7891]|uniref:Dihydrodipicolinate synthase family protein n=1 Tax=Pseudomonas karstica TaxID=1055468 RepID=A0A7X2UXE9_9PSED|nr:dihydrodipicolinate synthase family protein [Pseudomonas karstica]MTD17985.1 dihydrodipicolinate synthase family protein [Pseudomonas karstica]